MFFNKSYLIDPRNKTFDRFKFGLLASNSTQTIWPSFTYNSQKLYQSTKSFEVNENNKTHIFKIINGKINIWITDSFFSSFAFHIATWWTSINFLKAFSVRFCFSHWKSSSYSWSEFQSVDFFCCLIFRANCCRNGIIELMKNEI